jgi:hypothetical protein
LVVRARFFRHRFGIFSLPLSQLTAIDPDESTDEAIGDWHYWVAHGYYL